MVVIEINTHMHICKQDSKPVQSKCEKGGNKEKKNKSTWINSYTDVVEIENQIKTLTRELLGGVDKGGVSFPPSP